MKELSMKGMIEPKNGDALLADSQEVFVSFESSGGLREIKIVEMTWYQKFVLLYSPWSHERWQFGKISVVRDKQSGREGSIQLTASRAVPYKLEHNRQQQGKVILLCVSSCFVLESGFTWEERNKLATDPCSRVILCLVSCKSWNATDQELARLGIPTMNSTQRRSQSHNSRFPRILWIHKTSDIIVSFFFGIHPLSVKEEGKIQDIQSLINYLIRSSSLLFLFLMYFFCSWRETSVACCYSVSRVRCSHWRRRTDYAAMNKFDRLLSISRCNCLHWCACHCWRICLPLRGFLILFIFDQDLIQRKSWSELSMVSRKKEIPKHDFRDDKHCLG